MDSKDRKSTWRDPYYTEEMELHVMSQKKPVVHVKHEVTITASSSPTTPQPSQSGHENIISDFIADFRRAPDLKIIDKDALYANSNTITTTSGRSYDLRAANVRTANTTLVRDLKGRHLQMIAIGGSIGAGLFVASGTALSTGGPASLLIAYVLMGAMQYCTMQALGELVVMFPVAGAFSSYSTRFLDPSWGFAMGWNYALQWLILLPTEIIAGAVAMEYWSSGLKREIFVTLFLFIITIINLFGVRGYGEAEFFFSMVKVVAIISFILLGIVINIGGHPDSGYIGFQYWQDPGAFNNGFKGFCSILVTAAFAFGGTELVGLAAAETSNPRKSFPSAIKQVFWRIIFFYLGSLAVVGMLVPYDEPRLLGADSSSDAKGSPFVIAIESIGTTILPSLMNCVIVVGVMSVGNSAVYASTRTLAALAEQSMAPQCCAYVDRRGRPLVAIAISLAIGLLAYVCTSNVYSDIFTWLLAISGLSTLFTWASISLCHIRFRKSWRAAGYSLHDLPFKSHVGVVGSWVTLCGYAIVLLLQIWIAAAPIESGSDTEKTSERVQNFMSTMLTVIIILLFWAAHKIWHRTRAVSLKGIDLDTGRRYSGSHHSIDEDSMSRRKPMWKRVFQVLC
ncbi:putative Amino acid permease-domain-containing protein [Seiridium cardinale]